MTNHPWKNEKGGKSATFSTLSVVPAYVLIPDFIASSVCLSTHRVPF